MTLCIRMHDMNGKGAQAQVTLSVGVLTRDFACVVTDRRISENGKSAGDENSHARTHTERKAAITTPVVAVYVTSGLACLLKTFINA